MQYLHSTIQHGEIRQGIPVSKAVKFTETENKLVVSRSGGRENWELLFNGDGISMLQDEMYSGD